MTKESKSITDYFKDKVVKEFAIKSTIFIGFIIGLRTFLLYFSYTNFFKSNFGIPGFYRLPFLSGLNFGRFLNALIFTAVIGVVLLSKKIHLLKFKKQEKKQTIEFIVLFLVYFILYYIYLYWLKGASPIKILIPLLMILRYIFQISYLFFLACAIFGFDFIKQFIIKPQKNQLLIKILIKLKL